MKKLEFYHNIQSLKNSSVKTLPSNLRILDNTLRDGEQTVGVVFSRQDKIDIVRSLAMTGITDAEVGFPAVSEEERQTIRAVVDQDFDIRLHGLCRLLTEDVDHALNCGIKNITMFLPGSSHYRFKVLNITENELEDHIKKVVDYAHSKGANIKFSCENASRMRIEELIRLYGAAIINGVKLISFPDTSGVMTPSATAEIVSWLRSELKVDVSVHFHNDLGMATANTIVAAEAGAIELQGCINGLGERAGNASVEEIALILATQYNRSLNLQFEHLAETSELVYRLSGLKAGFNKPIFGSNVFSHESGIHVSSIVENEGLYEAFPPELIGRKHNIVMGKHSGLVSIDYYLTKHGIEMNSELKKTILNELKSLAESKLEINLMNIINKIGAMQ